MADPAVGLLEDVPHQGVAREGGAAPGDQPAGRLHEDLDLAHLGGRPSGDLGHALEHVEHPGLPGLVAGHGVEQAVVFRPIGQDVAAEVEQRLLQQARLDEVERVEDAPRPAIAVGEGVDGLELVMRRRHADQRVRPFRGVQVVLPVGEESADDFLPDRRGVRHAGVVGEDGARQPADRHRVPLEPRADLLRQPGAHRQLGQPVVALEERLRMTARLA